jgi:UDP-GlcNAc:undecaprenyl-phosphate GlcNAc-1-phosphate transferase
MRWLVLSLVPVAFAVSVPLTWLMVRLGHRLGTYDSPGVAGQVKAPRRRVPNTGGIAVFWAIAGPMLVGLGLVWSLSHQASALPAFLEPIRAHVDGIQRETPLAGLVLACMAALHALGLIDDRRPLGPWLKLVLMVGAACAVPLLSKDTRLLTLLNAYVGGPWLSILITALWIVVVTNAMNFLDNMDGLSAGVAATAAGCFLAATMLSGQWFVGACLALLIGACLGFLVFNFPREGGARIFMGDGGSLVIGFLLAFLTVRTTYYGARGEGPSAPGSGGWYGVLMPLVVLAVPLYDFTSVVLIRLAQGRSPFVGDTQHLSHRLVHLGLSRRGAVAVIYGLTAITGIAGIALGSLAPWQALLVGVQTILTLLVIALFEYARAKAKRE